MLRGTPFVRCPALPDHVLPRAKERGGASGPGAGGGEGRPSGAAWLAGLPSHVVAVLSQGLGGPGERRQTGAGAMAAAAAACPGRARPGETDVGQARPGQAPPPSRGLLSFLPAPHPPHPPLDARARPPIPPRPSYLPSASVRGAERGPTQPQRSAARPFPEPLRKEGRGEKEEGRGKRDGEAKGVGRGRSSFETLLLGEGAEHGGTT